MIKKLKEGEIIRLDGKERIIKFIPIGGSTNKKKPIFALLYGEAGIINNQRSKYKRDEEDNKLNWEFSKKYKERKRRKNK